jgi:hypothetical protein
MGVPFGYGGFGVGLSRARDEPIVKRKTTDRNNGVDPAMVRREGGAFLQVRVLPRQLTVRPRSYGRAAHGQPGVVKPPGQPSSKGGPASPWAATRVNPEQASKANRESRPAHSTGKAVVSGTGKPSRFRASRRGSGGGTRRQNASQHGRPTEARGTSPLDRPVGGGPK